MWAKARDPASRALGTLFTITSKQDIFKIQIISYNYCITIVFNNEFDKLQ